MYNLYIYYTFDSFFFNLNDRMSDNLSQFFFTKSARASASISNKLYGMYIFRQYWSSRPITWPKIMVRTPI